MKKIKFDDIKFVLLAAVLGFVLFGVVFYMLGFYPFGSNTMMKVDLYHQYGPFHEEFRKKILNGESLLYSWEGGLGKEMLTQIAYYTASPVSFLMLLFPQRLMSDAMALFVLIKVGAAAGFFALYLKLRFGRNDISIVIFSVLYAFMSYISCYYWNIMWLDAIAFFPMVAYGIEELVHKGKVGIYGIFLALSIIVNFYIAFLVCVFAVLYFAVVLFSTYSLKKDGKTILSRIGRFVLVSSLAGGVCMFLEIPTVIALGRTSTSDSSFPDMKIYENIYQVITNHFFGARPVVLGRNEDLPNVYSGVLTMLLMPLFFLNKRIATKEKVLYGVFIAFMIVCSCVNTFDYLIHGAHFPSNLPHRYTFIYSFVLIVMAYRSFIEIKNFKISTLWKFFAFYTVVILVTEKLIAPNYDKIDLVLSDSELAINIILMGVYIAVVNEIAKHKGRSTSGFIYILSAMVIVESVASCYLGISTTSPNKRGEYVKYLDGTNEILDYIKENDHDKDKFFRQEFRRFTTINEGSLYHFNGFSQFSSMAYGATSELIGDIGIAATGNSYRLYDPTPIVEDMFNLKYIMNKDGEMDKPGHTLLYKYDGVERDPIILDDGSEEQQLTYDSGSVYLYRNDECLPLGFMVNNDVEKWNTKLEDPFRIQNQFAELATGIKDEIETEIKVEKPTYENIKITEEDEEKNYYKYDLTYPNSTKAIPKVMTSLFNPKEQNVFLYVDAGNAKRVIYTIDGKKEDRELSAGKSLFDCGIVPANTTINVEFTLDRKGEFEKTFRQNGNFTILAAGYNQDTYKKVYDKLNEHTMNVDEYGDTWIKGTVDGGNGGLLFTSIPYDDGWSVKVDGVERETKKIAGDGLIGVDIESGEHKIEFNYYPSGFNMGCIISVVSLILSIAYALYLKKTAAPLPSEKEEINDAVIAEEKDEEINQKKKKKKKK
ncbi:MAG: YfhO family protein [Firmicutes bacterium]|nr:YfhO family protein [Bacillota bacterium]